MFKFCRKIRCVTKTLALFLSLLTALPNALPAVTCADHSADRTAQGSKCPNPFIDSRPAFNAIRHADRRTMTIPGALGRIEESFQGTSGRRVYYIQDIHDSLEAQENIAKLIRYFVNHRGVRTVLEEGYEGAVPTEEYFGSIKDAKVKERFAYFLMDQLRIGGAEYAHITQQNRVQGPGDRVQEQQDKTKITEIKIRQSGSSTLTYDSAFFSSPFTEPRTLDPKPSFQLIGADSIEDHLANVKAYSDHAAFQSDAERELLRIENKFRTLGRKVWPAAFQEWLKVYESMEAGKLDPLNYARHSRSIDPQAFEGGAFALLSGLLSSHAPVRKSVSIQAKDFVDEIKKIEMRIESDFLKNETSSKTYHFLKQIKLLRKLNRLELSEEEYRMVAQDLSKVRTESIADFVFMHDSSPLILSKAWEQMIPGAVKFYELALKRESAIAYALAKQSAKSRAQSQNQKQRHLGASNENAMRYASCAPLVLVFGGFHKEGIKKILKNRGDSYVIMTPRITKESNRHQDFYKMLMSGGLHPFEKSLGIGVVSSAAVPPRYFEIITSAQSGQLARQFARLKDFTPELAERELDSIRSELRNDYDDLTPSAAPIDWRKLLRRHPVPLSAEEFDALVGLGNRVAAHGGNPINYSREAMHRLLPFPLNFEGFLAETPEQSQLVAATQNFEFNEGFLYAGIQDLSEFFLKGELRGTISFSRSAHQWAATYAFEHPGSHPGIVMIDTQKFNDRLRVGMAQLTLRGTDPYPVVHGPLSYEDIREVWVTDATWKKFLTLRELVGNDHLIQQNWRKLVSDKKIRVIPDLVANKAGQDPRVVVGRYVIQRNLLKDMPTLRPLTAQQIHLNTQGLTQEHGFYRLGIDFPFDYGNPNKAVILEMSPERNQQSLDSDRPHTVTYLLSAKGKVTRRMFSHLQIQIDPVTFRLLSWEFSNLSGLEPEDIRARDALARDWLAPMHFLRVPVVPPYILGIPDSLRSEVRSENLRPDSFVGDRYLDIQLSRAKGKIRVAVRRQNQQFSSPAAAFEFFIREKALRGAVLQKQNESDLLIKKSEKGTETLLLQGHLKRFAWDLITWSVNQVFNEQNPRLEDLDRTVPPFRNALVLGEGTNQSLTLRDLFGQIHQLDLQSGLHSSRQPAEFSALEPNFDRPAGAFNNLSVGEKHMMILMTYLFLVADPALGDHERAQILANYDLNRPFESLQKAWQIVRTRSEIREGNHLREAANIRLRMSGEGERLFDIKQDESPVSFHAASGMTQSRIRSEVRNEAVPGDGFNLNDERTLSQAPDQRRLIESGDFLEYGEGLVYLGVRDLMPFLEEGEIRNDGLDIRRTFQAAVSDASAQSAVHPAVLLVSASTLNRLLLEGGAQIHLLDHEPRVTLLGALQWDEVREVWIRDRTWNHLQSIRTAERRRRDIWGRLIRKTTVAITSLSNGNRLDPSLIQYVSDKGYLNRIPVFQRMDVSRIRRNDQGVVQEGEYLRMQNQFEISLKDSKNTLELFAVWDSSSSSGDQESIHRIQYLVTTPTHSHEGMHALSPAIFSLEMSINPGSSQLDAWKFFATDSASIKSYQDALAREWLAPMRYLKVPILPPKPLSEKFMKRSEMREESLVNLVLKGGGTRLIAVIGALEVVWERGVRIASVSGVSGGGFAAGLLAAGYTPEELKDIFLASKLDAVQDPVWKIPENLLARGGAHSHERLLAWIRERIIRKKSRDITIGELSIPFHAGVTIQRGKSNKKELLFLDSITAPNLPLSWAMTLTQILTPFFAPVRAGHGNDLHQKITGVSPGDMIFDGVWAGVLGCGFPVMVYADEAVRQGLSVWAISTENPEREVDTSLSPFAERLQYRVIVPFMRKLPGLGRKMAEFDLALDGHDSRIREVYPWARYFRIPVKAGTLQLQMHPSRKESLIHEGRRAMSEMLRSELRSDGLSRRDFLARSFHGITAAEQIPAAISAAVDNPVTPDEMATIGKFLGFLAEGRGANLKLHNLWVWGAEPDGVFSDRSGARTLFDLARGSAEILKKAGADDSLIHQIFEELSRGYLTQFPKLSDPTDDDTRADIQAHPDRYQKYLDVLKRTYQLALNADPDFDLWEYLLVRHNALYELKGQGLEIPEIFRRAKKAGQTPQTAARWIYDQFFAGRVELSARSAVANQLDQDKVPHDPHLVRELIGSYREHYKRFMANPSAYAASDSATFPDSDLRKIRSDYAWELVRARREKVIDRFGKPTREPSSFYLKEGSSLPAQVDTYSRKYEAEARRSYLKRKIEAARERRAGSKPHWRFEQKPDSLSELENFAGHASDESILERDPDEMLAVADARELDTRAKESEPLIKPKGLLPAPSAPSRDFISDLQSLALALFNDSENGNVRLTIWAEWKQEKQRVIPRKIHWSKAADLKSVRYLSVHERESLTDTWDLFARIPKDRPFTSKDFPDRPFQFELDIPMGQTQERIRSALQNLDWRKTIAIENQPGHFRWNYPRATIVLPESRSELRSKNRVTDLNGRLTENLEIIRWLLPDSKTWDFFRVGDQGDQVALETQKAFEHYLKKISRTESRAASPEELVQASEELAMMLSSLSQLSALRLPISEQSQNLGVGHGLGRSVELPFEWRKKQLNLNVLMRWREARDKDSRISIEIEERVRGREGRDFRKFVRKLVAFRLDFEKDQRDQYGPALNMSEPAFLHVLTREDRHLGLTVLRSRQKFQDYVEAAAQKFFGTFPRRSEVREINQRTLDSKTVTRLSSEGMAMRTTSSRDVNRVSSEVSRNLTSTISSRTPTSPSLTTLNREWSSSIKTPTSRAVNLSASAEDPLLKFGKKSKKTSASVAMSPFPAEDGPRRSLIGEGGSYALWAPSSLGSIIRNPPEKVFRGVRRIYPNRDLVNINYNHKSYAKKQNNISALLISSQDLKRPDLRREALVLADQLGQQSSVKLVIDHAEELPETDYQMLATFKSVKLVTGEFRNIKNQSVWQIITSVDQGRFSKREPSLANRKRFLIQQPIDLWAALRQSQVDQPIPGVGMSQGIYQVQDESLRVMLQDLRAQLVVRIAA